MSYSINKMYSEFSGLGFASNHFYADDDTETAAHLEHAIAFKPRNIIELLPDYFTLIAPGGCRSTSERESFDARFMTYDGGRFSGQLAAIRTAIEAWARSPSFDAQPTLRAIFLTLQNPCFTWFGYAETDRPPTQGFFIDREFGVDQTGN